ncbi:EF-hand domain-containing protein [Caenorhabditis elegans]|uniref:EF-hand domain-containing protein n=2 Tax=Caenorhabditis elegans TaxID=6239 RepID=O45313_CAEEL|nr:EF-hand domain-containing protein [Caenorhabditis elegans]CAB03995.2 EF-hand domain-containing protein [Caenorhabditis elegans]|eukprot:NP_001256829.1 Neuronal Calcium Sensor family [Caenorhabditis elegans]
MGGASSIDSRRGDRPGRKSTMLQDQYEQSLYQIIFDRAVHNAYSEPPKLFTNSIFDTLFHRLYWSIRALQFKIFYKNEDMDLDEVVDKWEIGVQPPSLEQLTQRTQFSPKWIKYMYAKFKNESPTGKMKEEEFRNLLASIIAPEKATDQYISRLFTAFAGVDKKTITFENLLDSLSHVQPQTAETNAKWTMRLITGGGEGDCFGYSAFLDFTQSVFQLNEGKSGGEEINKESVQQRATKIFAELDCDRDGLVTYDDMIRFFQKNNDSSIGFTPVSPAPNGFANCAKPL